MKKLLILVMPLFCVAVFFSGCTKESDTLEAKSYTSEGENITSIHINVCDKEIEVTSSTDEFVHINYYENDTRYYNISVNNKNGDISGFILGSCDIKKGDSNLSSNDNGAVKNLYVTKNNGNIDFK